MMKYFFGHIKTTRVHDSGKMKTNKNNKNGTKVVSKTKITLIAAMIAINAMDLPTLSNLLLIVIS